MSKNIACIYCGKHTGWIGNDGVYSQCSDCYNHKRASRNSTTEKYTLIEALTKSVSIEIFEKVKEERDLLQKKCDDLEQQLNLKQSD